MMRLGLVINPLAGIGGTVGLKGSDGDEIVSQAFAKGAVPLAEKRVYDALNLLDRKLTQEILTVNGSMGENVLSSLGLRFAIAHEVNTNVLNATTADDTQAAVKAFVKQGVDLIVFAGGDGTATDVYKALQVLGKDEVIPVIGIPAGCKIHSAVYSTSPTMAGEMLQSIINGRPMTLKLSEVMDLDEDAFRSGVVKASCYGYLTVPVDDVRMQVIKQGGVEYDAIALQDIAAGVVENMEADCLYIIGTGSTTAAVMNELGLDNTLLGVDVVLNGLLIASDVDESQLLEMLNKYRAKIIVSIIGGQGYMFGRGNQQLSPQVISKVGVDNIIVIATNEKLRALNAKPLLVDTGDKELDELLQGTVSVVSGYEQKTLISVR